MGEIMKVQFEYDSDEELDEIIETIENIERFISVCYNLIRDGNPLCVGGEKPGLHPFYLKKNFN